MTSEIENILNGQVVRKVNADKAIGVSTANLMPDEKGEVPLSKQSAFDMAPSMETQSGSVAPAQEATEQVNLTQSAPDNQSLSTPVEDNTPIMPTSAVTPSESVVSDTISETPVDVTEPTQLGGIDFNSVIPDIPFANVEMQPQEQVEPEAKTVELPKMPETILAEEPTSVNEGLFVDSGAPAPENNPIISTGEIDVSSVPQAESVDSQIDTTVAETDKVGEPTSEVLSDEAPSDETITTEEVAKKSIFSPEGTLEESELIDNEYSGNKLPNNDSEQANSELLEDIKKVETIENEKLEKINETLNEIVESLREIKTLFDEKQVKAEESAIEQPTNAPILPQEPSAQVEQNQTPAATLAPEPAPMVPAMDIPLFEGPSLELSTGMVQAPDIGNQGDMVNALDQIDASEIPAVDETPIKGGMFI